MSDLPMHPARDRCITLMYFAAAAGCCFGKGSKERERGEVEGGFRGGGHGGRGAKGVCCTGCTQPCHGSKCRYPHIQGTTSWLNSGIPRQHAEKHEFDITCFKKQIHEHGFPDSNAAVNVDSSG